jgi:hypothetical protein
MITKEILKIYKKYKGDIDMWARLNRKDESSLINDKDWQMIENCINDIRLISRGLAADTYKNELRRG